MFDPILEDEELDFEDSCEISLEVYNENEQEEPMWNVYETYASFDNPEEIEDY
jgi:hypothetical protein